MYINYVIIQWMAGVVSYNQSVFISTFKRVSLLVATSRLQRNQDIMTYFVWENNHKWLFKSVHIMSFKLLLKAVDTIGNYLK